MVESTWAVFSWTLIFNRWAFFSNLIAEIAGEGRLEGRKKLHKNILNGFLKRDDICVGFYDRNIANEIGKN